MYLIAKHPEIRTYDAVSAYREARFDVEQIGLHSCITYVTPADCAIRFTIKTRRDFALLFPLLARTEKADLEIAVHGNDTTVRYQEKTADFWKLIAKAQAWYKMPMLENEKI